MRRWFWLLILVAGCATPPNGASSQPRSRTESDCLDKAKVLAFQARFPTHTLQSAVEVIAATTKATLLLQLYELGESCP